MKLKVLRPVILKRGQIADCGEILDSEEQGWDAMRIGHLTAIGRVAEFIPGHEPITDTKIAGPATFTTMAPGLEKKGKGK